jgi:preprotein translocase subunit SecG
MPAFIKKHPIIVLIIGLIFLIMLQRELIMPLVNTVVKSDLFLVESNDQGDMLPVSTSLTAMAFLHCNAYIKSELDPDISIAFPEKPINAWSLGNHQYVINAEIGITTETSGTSSKKYVCRIIYDKGDDESGIADFDNWSIYGLSGLDDL